MKYNTITKAVAATVPGGVYEGIDYHGTPPAAVAARAGWVDVTPEIQAQIDADKAAADAAAESEQAAFLATPELRDRSLQFKGAARIETDADDGHVYGLEVDEASGTVFVVQRESDRLTHAEYMAARAARKAALKAEKDALKAELDALKAKAAKAETDVAAAVAEIEKLKKPK